MSENFYEVMAEMLGYIKECGAKRSDVMVCDAPKALRYGWAVKDPHTGGTMGRLFGLRLGTLKSETPEELEWLSKPENRILLCDPTVLEIVVMAREFEEKDESNKPVPPTHENIFDMLVDMIGEVEKNPNSKIIPCDDPRNLNIGWLAIFPKNNAVEGDEEYKVFSIRIHKVKQSVMASGICHGEMEEIDEFLNSLTTGEGRIAMCNNLPRVKEILSKVGMYPERI